MTFSFKYKSILLKSGKTIYRPLIPLTFYEKERIDVIAILDSGSDMTVVPKEIAEHVGVKYIGEDELSGITGTKIKAKQGKLNVSFGRGREIYNFIIPVIIPEKENISIIIGRIGFFDQFKITFSEKERKIIFKKISKRIFTY